LKLTTAFFLCATLALAQSATDLNKITIIPSANGSAVGEVDFGSKNGLHHTGIAGADTIPTNHVFRLPPVDAGGGGCWKTDGSYNTSIGSCGGASHALVTVLDTAGCDPTGVADSTACINAAVVSAAGGGLRIPAGTYLTGEIDIPSHTWISCDSGTTKLVRNGAIAAGHGWINLGNVGTVNVASDGITVTKATGDSFALLQVADRIYVNGVLKSVATLIDSTHITISPSTGGTLTGVSYVASRTGVTVDGCTFDGQVTTPAGFNRAGLTDALSATFTANSTLWLHGGKHISFSNDVFQHSGGWPAIDDGSGANVEDVSYSHATFQDNRSFLFGDASGGSQTYGSWPSGILNYSAGAFFFNKFSVTDSTFQRLTGTGIFWDAINGNSALNRNVIQSNNHFTTIGLDAILNSGINGLTQTGNTFDGIGFVSTSDTDLVGTAKWYNGPAAVFSIPGVAMDTASLVLNATITGNSAKRINGGCGNGDGLAHYVFAGNTCYNAMIGDPDYDGTVASQMGPAVYGPITALGQNYTTGYTSGNSNNTAQGGISGKVTGNLFHGLGGGSIQMFGARDSQVSDNVIVPCGNTNSDTDRNFGPPITLGNTGTGPYQRAQNNTVTKNKITYTGSVGMNAVVEDASYGAFATSDRNYVYDQDLSGNLAQFLKDANTVSVQYGAGSIVVGGATTNNYDFCQGLTGSAALGCMRIQTESLGIRSINFYDISGTSHKVGSIDTNGVINAVGAGTAGIAVNGTGVIGSAYDFFGRSLSTGTTPTIAASAAGLAIDGNRNAILNTVGIGANPTQITVIDAGRNIGNIVNLNGSGNLSMTGTIGAGGNISTLGTMTVTLGLSAQAATIGTGASSFGGNLGIGGAFSVTGNSSLTGTLGVGGAFSVTGGSTLTGAVGIGGTVNATGLGALSGAGSLLCLDGSGFIRSSLCPGGASAPLVLGSTSFSGSPLQVLSHGGYNATNDYTPIVGLMGTAATSVNAVQLYFEPASFGLVRESALMGAAVSTVGSSNWEINGVTGMVVAKNSVSNHVAGSFFGASIVSGGIIEGLNSLSQDADWTNTTCTGQYSSVCHFPSTLIGYEMDLNVWDTGSNVAGINTGVTYLNGHPSYPVASMSINMPGAICFGCGVTNYFDYGIKTSPGAAIVGIHLDRQNGGTVGAACTAVGGLCSGASVGTNSQFVDLVSGTTGQYTTRIFSTTGGFLGFFPDTFHQSNYVAVGPTGTLFVEGGNVSLDGNLGSCTPYPVCVTGTLTASGAAGIPSVIATNGYMQSAEGFYSPSVLPNVLNLPNGGASIKNLAVTNTVYNSIQSSGGATLAGTIRATAQTAVAGTGTGTELLYDTGTSRGYLQAYNRSASAFVPLSVDGLTLNLNVQTNGLVNVGFGGISVSGASTFSNAVTFNGGIILGFSGISAGGHSGYTGTINTRNSANSGTCTLDFAAGVFYGSTGC
jgi:hypothetical protein